MAAAILALLSDNEGRQRLAREARQFIEETVSATSAGRVFEQICQRAIGSHNSQ
jgi:hypothetical protein